jgi:hypothetical protein
MRKRVRAIAALPRVDLKGAHAVGGPARRAGDESVHASARAVVDAQHHVPQPTRLHGGIRMHRRDATELVDAREAHGRARQCRLQLAGREQDEMGARPTAAHRVEGVNGAREAHLHAMREAISGNQRMREAIRGNQWRPKGPPEEGHPALTQNAHSDSIRRTPTPSDAIRGHQRPSEAIRRHQRPSEAIRRHQTPSDAVRPSRAARVGNAQPP